MFGVKNSSQCQMLTNNNYLATVLCLRVVYFYKKGIMTIVTVDLGSLDCWSLI